MTSVAQQNGTSNGTVTCTADIRRITLNGRERVEISFPNRPGAAVRTRLRANAWRWDAEHAAWFKRAVPGIEDEAASIVGSAASDFASMTSRQLKHLIKERRLGDGFDLWHAKKGHMVDLLEGRISSLPTASPFKGTRTAPAQSSDTSPPTTYSRDELRAMVEDILAKRPDVRPVIHVTIPATGETRKIEGTTHAKFAEVLRLVAARIPVLLVGPAGSGKTHLAAQIAEALGVAFTFNSMSAGVTESSLLGRVLPDEKGNWTYRPAPFVRTYADGGLHLFDEMDAADPNLLVVINAALANGALAIPFADIPPIKRNDKTFLIAAANTYGNGADRQYVGRNQLDAATVDRFTMGTVEIDYDRTLEAALVAAIVEDKIVGDYLLVWAWQIRESIAKHRLRRLMSTRSIENAAKRIAGGATLEDVQRTYFLSWSADERRQVEGGGM